MTAFDALTVEQLEQQFKEALFKCRYYHNTDDYGAWEKETTERIAADKQLKLLTIVFKQRGIAVPNF